jgi:protein SCO1
MRWFLLLILLHLAPSLANAGSIPDLAGVGFEQRNGAAAPLDAPLRDDDGKILRLSDIIGGRPLILTLGYFRCASLCGLVRANLLKALEEAQLVPGRDFSFAALSIDATETAEEARTIKWKELEPYRTFEAQNLHFLTGDGGAVNGLAEAVGFRSRAVRATSFAHPLGLVFVSPSGVISSYMLGIAYRPEDVRLALQQAAAGDIVRPALPLLSLCYDFDAVTGRYTLAVMKVLRTVSALAGAVALFVLARVVFSERLRM